MPPEVLIGPLPMPVLSLSEPDLLPSSFFFFESEPLRGRNTSNIVGLRFGLAIPKIKRNNNNAH